MDQSDHSIRFHPPSNPLGHEVAHELREALSGCPDLAFAYLVDVHVDEFGDAPNQSLFVWLQPEALSSLRGALNLVSEAVARTIPGDRFLDVLILNSAPELLVDLERSGCLFVERDSGERARAIEAVDRIS